jgi:phosphatidylglycerol lysyltransferase
MGEKGAGAMSGAVADPVLTSADRDAKIEDRWLQALPVLAGLVFCFAVFAVLRTEWRAVSWAELASDVISVPRRDLALAVALTIVNYAVLTGYDVVAFLYIGKILPRGRVLLTAFLAYGVANTAGFGALSGASVRYRFYSRWGVTPQDLSRIVFSYSVTFWLGLLALGGLSLAMTTLPESQFLPAGPLVKAAGWILMSIPVMYVIAAGIRRAPLRLWTFAIPFPTLRIAVAQLTLSILDWTLAGTVLYVLLPPSALSFLDFLGLFLIAILLGLISHIPGGLGVFEGLMVLLLRPYLDSWQLLPALLVFRAVYYLLPLSIALVILVADEVLQRRGLAARAGAVLARTAQRLTPRVLASFTFLAGALLLFSGATPALDGRLAMLARVLPLGVIEASHFIASVVGTLLLLLSQGVARRLNVAFYLTAALMSVGIATSLLKGFDYEEAALLLGVLLLLGAARPAFARHAAFFETRFSTGWIVCVVGTVAASIWLGQFVFKHVDYSNDLWWQFELHGDASRYLRASVGAAIALLVVTFARLIGFAPHETPSATDQDLHDAENVIAGQASTLPNLVFLRDKALLFDHERAAFVMYAVQGRTWVALGDPVGPAERRSALVRLFLERCHDFGGVPVFYQVGPTELHRYADFGLTFVKIGEEAKVDLRALTLQGRHAAKLRQPLHRLEREKATFRIVDTAQVPDLLEELRAVSRDWLGEKSAAEKGFSLGYFDEDYLARFPVAVIERGGRVEAFANVWPGAGRVELSVDLMRHRRDAPNGVMEALFVHVMCWGKENGFQWFNLGMAPLSGFESSAASLWTRLGSFVYEHGESVYNFQGLRAFKEKFNPIWEPRYLAYPGGLHLPRILTDVAALVAGGYRRIFLK